MTAKGARCSRREALAIVAIGSATTLFARPATAFSDQAFSAESAQARADASRVTTYFNDGLLADPTGIMPPYRRPRAFRGARRISQLSEAQRIAAGFGI